jgi:malonyl CoA-acyl carrier protein transacylase
MVAVAVVVAGHELGRSGLESAASVFMHEAVKALARRRGELAQASRGCVGWLQIDGALGRGPFAPSESLLWR